MRVSATAGRVPREHRVRWDEPDEEDSPEIRRHNAALERARNKRQDAKERLKSKGAVPTKVGKPIFKGNLVVTGGPAGALHLHASLFS